MTTAYRVEFYNTAGVLQYEMTLDTRADESGLKAGLRSLAYVKQVDAPGVMQFAVRGDHALVAAIADKWQVEVWRKPLGASWTRDFVGIFRQPQWNYGNMSVFSSPVPGLMSMLGWKIINWPANTTSRTKFSSAKGETIMKTLVDYNAGANATTGNGRKRVGTITGLTVQADGANGNTVNWYCAQDNLLDNLQKLAQVAGGDFDLVKTSATAWQFRWYTGQLGTDRSASVTFSMERGNMSNPVFTIPRLQERTVACVWGQGTDANRDYATRTGTNYVLDSNDIEVYVNASDVELGDTSGLNARGDQAMYEMQARPVFSFDVLQAPQTRYGVHYFLGDKVTAINPFAGTSYTVKINQVAVSFSDQGDEKIAVEAALV